MTSKSSNIDSTLRFSDRVDYYVRFRPRYPVAIREFMIEEMGLTAAKVVADIGSGTGFLSELFLQNGNRVIGVEPNREMREAGKALLQEFPHFVTVNATAEATTLANSSVDFIVAGQAFHWFDIETTKIEFARILKTDGFVALVWNQRRKDTTPLLRDYEDLLRRSNSDYNEVTHHNSRPEDLQAFFSPDTIHLKRFENVQEFDWDGFKGRFLSSSYAPLPGHLEHEPMIVRLHELFQKHEQHGRVVFPYDTQFYFGHLRG